MKTYSFTLAGARLAYLLSLIRVDETIIRLTNYSKPITIGGNTWYPEPGLEIGDITENNRGDIPSLSFSVATGSLFVKEDIDNRLFERATAILEICNARNPTSKDEEFSGVLTGEVSFDLGGNAKFEVLQKFGKDRDVFIRKYTIPDDVYFGDPRRSKIPTFPTVDPTSDDLADVERNTTYAVGDRRRFRYDTDDEPSDYHDVYWEVTAQTGPTDSTDPVSPSDTPGDTVTDGDVTWTVRNAYARAFTVTDIIDENHIEIDVTEPRASGDTTWFAPGMIVMRSGYLKNFGSKVNAWDGTDQISLVMPFANLLEVGDTGEIAPDYDQTLDMAVDKYDNANNFRGFPHLTGARIATSTFIPGITVDNPDGDDPGAGGGGFEAFAVEFEAGST